MKIDDDQYVDTGSDIGIIHQYDRPTVSAPAEVDGIDAFTDATAARAEAWRPWRGYAVLHLWHLPTEATEAAAA